MEIQIKDENDKKTTVMVPINFIFDSYMIKNLHLDDCEDVIKFIEDINKDGGLPFSPIPKQYMEFVVNYYNHYTKYFSGEVKINDEDRYDVISQKVLDNPNIIPVCEKEFSKRIPRRNDIPTEVFYIGMLNVHTNDSIDISKMSSVELANMISMCEEHEEWWVNKFEKKLLNKIHWQDSNETINGYLSGNALRGYFGLTGYYQMNSFGRFIELAFRADKYQKMNGTSGPTKVEAMLSGAAF